METDAKPPLKFDDLIEIAARRLVRARRANLSGDRAVADLVLRDLCGAGCGSSGSRRDGSRERTKKEPRPREKGGASWLG